MDPKLTHAIFGYWWAWNAPDTKKAVWRALADSYACVAEECFRRNRAAGRKPVDWVEFTALGRTLQTIERGRDGKQNTTLEFLLGVAGVLGIEPAALFPPLINWVAAATIYLVAPAGVRPSSATRANLGFDLADAKVYTDAVLAHPPRGDRAVTRKEIEVFLADRPPAVRDVAVRLAPVLNECYARMTGDPGQEVR